MTEPLYPDPREPFTTLIELAMWTQRPSISGTTDIAFANQVLAAVAVCVRHYGSPTWTIETIPPRAKLVADLKAKNFFEHPTGAISESVGPLSESFVKEVLTQVDFTAAEQALLASIAADDGQPGTTPGVGLWSLSTTRGPLETHTAGHETIHVPHAYPGAKQYPYYPEGALGSPW